jgi:hypothetical protein
VILGNQNYEKEKSKNEEWIYFLEYIFFTLKTKVNEEHYWVPFGNYVKYYKWEMHCMVTMTLNTLQIQKQRTFTWNHIKENNSSRRY